MALLLRRRGEFVAARGRVSPAQLGLEQFPPRGVLLQFSTPGSRPSRISLNRLAAAVAASRGEAIVVELLISRREHLAERLAVRVTPTVLHLDSSGVVRRRWTRVPERHELDAALADAWASLTAV